MGSVREKKIKCPDRPLRAFRLSKSVGDLLDKVAAESGMDKTAVVELCVAKYATTIPVDLPEARKALAETIMRQINPA